MSNLSKSQPVFVYLGGYKSALNRPFLKEKNIRLIVNVAPGLERVFGEKYLKQRRAVFEDKDLKGLEEVIVNWQDDLQQVMDKVVVLEV